MTTTEYFEGLLLEQETGKTRGGRDVGGGRTNAGGSMRGRSAVAGRDDM